MNKRTSTTYFAAIEARLTDYMEGDRLPINEELLDLVGKWGEYICACNEDGRLPVGTGYWYWKFMRWALRGRAKDFVSFARSHKGKNADYALKGIEIVYDKHFPQNVTAGPMALGTFGWLQVELEKPGLFATRSKTRKYTIDELRSMASSGDVKAQRTLATILIRDNSNADNYGEGISLFMKLADRGDESSINQMVSIYFTNQLEVTAKRIVQWLEKGVQLNQPFALLVFGSEHVKDSGLGLEYDLEKGIALLEKAASLGNSHAELNLGEVYENYVKPADLQEAVKWYKRAAEHGNTIAMRNLAIMYALAQGVPHDPEKGLHLAFEAGMKRVQDGDLDGAANCLSTILNIMDDFKLKDSGTPLAKELVDSLISKGYRNPPSLNEGDDEKSRKTVKMDAAGNRDSSHPDDTQLSSIDLGGTADEPRANKKMSKELQCVLAADDVYIEFAKGAEKLKAIAQKQAHEFQDLPFPKSKTLYDLWQMHGLEIAWWFKYKAEDNPAIKLLKKWVDILYGDGIAESLNLLERLNMAWREQGRDSVKSQEKGIYICYRDPFYTVLENISFELGCYEEGEVC